MTELHKQLNTVRQLNETADVVVTALQTTAGEALVGPVGRAGCMVAGEMACKTTCQLWALKHGAAAEGTAELVEAGMLDPKTILDDDPQACPDENLAKAFEELGVDPSHALMVAVGMNKTADRVGYVDSAEVQSAMVAHPRGWYELTAATPYNALFVDEGDTLPNGNPIELIGMRLAGNGLVVDEVRHADGRAYGMTHLTRTNMPGRGHEAEYDATLQTYRHHVAENSMGHYGAKPEDVTTHIVSAVGSETARVRFPDCSLLESVMPGWAQDGLITNISNPGWRPGMSLVNPITGEYDILHRDYPEQIRRHVHGAAQDLGVGNIREKPVLDPGDMSGGIVHSSADRVRNSGDNEDMGFAGNVTDRDLYAVVIKRQPTLTNFV